MHASASKTSLALVLAGAVSGSTVVLSPTDAGAVSAFHWQAMMLDSRVRAYEESRVGYGSTVGGAFGARHDWQGLRTGRATSSAATLRRAAVRNSPLMRLPLRFRPTARLGGLGRHLAGPDQADQRGERPLKFDRIFAPEAGAAPAPTFSGLREGASSFSFGLDR